MVFFSSFRKVTILKCATIASMSSIFQASSLMLYNLSSRESVIK
jgi:hypothetical protein